MSALPLPTTLPEFDRLFPDEASCIEYLFRVRWPDGFVCPRCGSTKARILPSRLLIRCSNKHDISVTAGTTFHRTKQSLRDWFLAIFLVATLKPSISAVQLQDQLGLSRNETAFNMLHKIRSALVDMDREPLKGEVEIDEAFIGGKEEGRRGRGAERKALVIVAVEVIRYLAPDPTDPKNPDAAIEKTRAGRVRMSVIPNAEAATLIPWVQSNIAPGSIVHTDGWSGYNRLGSTGYDHQPMLQTHKGAATGLFLPLVHLMISNLKRVLMGTYKGAVRRKHLTAYLNEYTFRFNRRFWRGQAFLRALQLMTNADSWPEYDTLYAAGTPWGWEHPDPDMAEQAAYKLKKSAIKLLPGDVLEILMRRVA